MFSILQFFIINSGAISFTTSKAYVLLHSIFEPLDVGPNTLSPKLLAKSINPSCNKLSLLITQ